MDAESVLAYVSGQPHGRTGFRTLARHFGVRSQERRTLQLSLRQLVSEGRLVEFRRGNYAVPGPSSEYVSGLVILHRDGYGFVVPDHPLDGVEGDIYVSRRSLAGAMHADRVSVQLGRISEDGRAEGVVQRILKRGQAHVVGQFHFSKRGSWVVPHDDRVRERIVISQGEELPPPDPTSDRLGNVSPPEVAGSEDLDGWIVYVELTQFPTGSEEARGRVIEVLGRPEDFGVDVEVIIRKFHLPYRFPSPALDEAGGFSKAIGEEEGRRRRDFRDFDVVTIDGESARDFDDAVWVDRLENGNFALHVHIADVSHYVSPGSALDEEARLRGTSAYFPDRAVPMLPAELSTGICSLNPQVDRLTLSALLEIDNRGETVGVEFCRGIIRSAERMTYPNVNLVLEEDAEQTSRYQRLVGRFRVMKELAAILQRRRERRGSIDFDLPEAVIEFDESGMMTGVTRAERNIAHRIIEEFMLAANEAVALHLEEREAPALYRVHEKPDPRRLLDFERLLSTFGYSLGVDVQVRPFGYSRRHRDGSKARHQVHVPEGGSDVSPKHYQKLIAQLEGKPEERILNYLMLRSLKQAHYSETNSGHFALATPYYTHFTSPIRRYPDLVVHRILKSVLDLDEGPADSNAAAKRRPTESALEQIAKETSFTERRAADAERALMDWKKARFMEGRLGDEFDAIVVSVTRYGLFVELLDLFVEGFVPIDSFQDEPYYYRENLRSLIGRRSKRRFGLGDRLRVRADRIAWDQMRAEFSWVDSDTGAEKAKPGRRKSKRRRGGA